MTDASPTTTDLQPTCPRHPDRAALNTCERCGSYACADCAGSQGRCEECRSQVAAVPSSAPRARWTSILLLASGGAAVINLLFSAAFLLTDLEEHPLFLKVFNTYVVYTIAFVDVVSYRLTPVVFLMWKYRVIRQLNTLGQDVGATPGWSVGWWFVPFANLVKPFRILQRTVKALSLDSLITTVHLGIWWPALLLTRTLRTIAERSPIGVFAIVKHNPILAYTLALGTPICAIVATILCNHIVRRTQERLDALRAPYALGR
ncbi:MAG: DUF4328 domain-containing protein [Myxococcaceae bacterium]|nr:MAG: DUF4328 domain-containing protein [Myxococcaceae bacterium]